MVLSWNWCHTTTWYSLAVEGSLIIFCNVDVFLIRNLISGKWCTKCKPFIFSAVQCFVTCTGAFPVWQTPVRAVGFEKAVMNSCIGMFIFSLCVFFLSSTRLRTVVVWVYTILNMCVRWGFTHSFENNSVRPFSVVLGCALTYACSSVLRKDQVKALFNDFFCLHTIISLAQYMTGWFLDSPFFCPV